MPGDVVPTFSVSELAGAVSLVLDTAFPTEVWVRGEIANLNRARSGHVYFSLIEPNELGRGATASLSVALLADRKYVVNQILRRAGGSVRMTDGVEVRLRAKVDFYAPTGRLTLLMTLIDPEYTLGKLVAVVKQLLSVIKSSIETGSEQEMHIRRSFREVSVDVALSHNATRRYRSRARGTRPARDARG